MNDMIAPPLTGELVTRGQRAMVVRSALEASQLPGLMEISRAMATARITVPKHLQGQVGDCLAIVIQAQQWGMNPFAVAQKTHLVNGTLGYESQLVNAVVSSCPLLASRINYEWEGDWKGVSGKTDRDDSRAVIVSATLRGEPKPRTLRVSMAQVGSVRNSPLWEHDPRQQLAYLAVKRWARLNAPDALLGVYSVDELQDAAPHKATESVTCIATDSISDGQRKRLEARITELGLDRDRVQEWCRRALFVDNFSDLPASAYDRIIGKLDVWAEAAKEEMAAERAEPEPETVDVITDF